MKNSKILLGITGGIAVYKICSLINKLKKNGAEVKVIMTEAATKFVTPVTFQTLSNNEVCTDMFAWERGHDTEHISLADWCDLAVIAPATANTIAKISHGLADNLLTSTVLALPKETPVLFVPAMNVHMWENPITQDNIKKLINIKISNKKDKYFMVEPREGILACGYKGKGVIAENEKIIEMINKIL
ncbi:MAG: flavoprotein [Patescibacteria group bacterium]|nr:flavoprotein [Patescibacteria group bacterium]MDD4611220.1 flavoprotein [Patescibacteria group bacterium]